MGTKLAKKKKSSKSNSKLKEQEINNGKEKIEEEDEKSNKNNILYNNFNINQKKLMIKITYHTYHVVSLCILDDGRLVSSSIDKQIIIYNKKTYKPDLIIKEFNDWISCIIKLKRNILASCSYDSYIKLFKIKDNNYEILQILKHWRAVNKIIELKNTNLASCSDDKSIILFQKENSKYEKKYEISTRAACFSLVQTKDNEICYLEKFHYYEYYYNIIFYNLNEKTIKKEINTENTAGGLGIFNMITKDLLIYSSENAINIINVNQYKIIRKIEIPNSKYHYGFCKLNKNIFLTTDSYGMINQWEIRDDNIYLISTKEKAHERLIYALINMGNGKIASCAADNSIKIW